MQRMSITEALDKAEILSDLVTGAPLILSTLMGIETWVKASVILVPDNKIISHPELLDSWSIGESYKKGNRIILAGQVFKALSDNTGAEETLPLTHPELWQNLSHPEER